MISPADISQKQVLTKGEKDIVWISLFIIIYIIVRLIRRLRKREEYIIDKRQRRVNFTPIMTK
ncbi:hypothetical protein ASZ90_017240 [hydrocarbon metagenome]|uniref:Uncharacterized protein n=1 Tax=hydrocarbon metagenome TaxID=938273 RepID=A0A0W8EA58_9ZZZZ